MTLTAEDFIRQHMVLSPLAFRPDILLYQPTPQSGLNRWLDEQHRGDEPPYWAYAWAGGAALAVHLLQAPETVAGRHVLDFGSGSGLVGIAAAKAGARVTAFEPDPIGRVATRLNALANAVPMTIIEATTDADIVLAGDVFYDAEVAAATLSTLQDLASRGAQVLVGDPYRRDLPSAHLVRLGEYRVPDFGMGELVATGVFRLLPA